MTEAQGSVSVPNLHGDNFDEYTLGYERLLGAGTRLTVRGLYRHLRSAYLVGYDFSRDPWFAMGTPGQGTFDFLPAPRRDYTALEIAAEGAWRGVRYRVSYVLSRSWGNYTGLFSSDATFNNFNVGQNVMFNSPEQVRISDHVGHRFRPMSDSDFGASRTPVSLDVGHLSGGGALDN